MSEKILFMCPHSAGKSLAAATYFRSAAYRAGLDVEIAIAGTDPDEVSMPSVVEALTAQGFTVDFDPRLVSAEDTAGAAVISIGCDRDAVPTDKDITEWDVPMIGADLLGSLNAIHDRCEALALSMSS